MQRFGAHSGTNEISPLIDSWILTDTSAGLSSLSHSWKALPGHLTDKMKFPAPQALRFEDDLMLWKRVISQASHSRSITTVTNGTHTNNNNNCNETEVTDGADSVVDLIFTANTFHVAPWTSCVTMFPRAFQCLRDQGALIVYGPFNVTDQHRRKMTNLADEGNAKAMTFAQNQFAKRLRSRFGPDAALRDVEAVLEAASVGGFHRIEHQVILPEGNIVLSWRK
ncbi:Hypothetical protein, putative [Bodo saltans]|uniref:Uncharacterized protein n=1 Tax=Bodo saltans TaxID=75058 RepID=A0A0S4IXZ5_BODSA|nr:Hypothetical protein, putative [Bodo saltans]|eukprot:CUG08006.1 Hypothetical protein, putative [Bodo saltans]